MVKIGVANLVTGLKKWLYFKNKLMAWTDFLHTGANSGKLKVDSVIFGWACLKMGVGV